MRELSKASPGPCYHSFGFWRRDKLLKLWASMHLSFEFF